MSNIIRDDSDNSTVSVNETTSSLITPHNYGVAGTDPLSDYSQAVNVLLCDAIKARWNLDLYNNDGPPFPYPSAEDIIWTNVWFTGSRDTEIIFKESFDDKPMNRRTIDWHRQGHVLTVDVHSFVRGAGGDVEPDALGRVIRGLDKVVALNHTTLIPNAVVDIVSSQPAPTEANDDYQTLWHYLTKMRVQFWKVKL